MRDQEVVAVAALIVFVLILILFGAGFGLKVLWYVAAIAFVLWLIGFFSRSESARWYRW